MREHNDNHDEREEENERRHEREQAAKRSRNDSKHVLDPDREWEEEEWKGFGD